jgi:glycosyltransferase involved in cell wall biosynthesis
MTVLHTVDSLHPDAGGPSRTVRATCLHLAARGVRVEVVTGRAHPSAPALAPAHSSVTTTFARTGRSLPRDAWTRWRVLGGRIRAARPAIVHDHGLWLPANALAALAAWRHGVPLVVTTRGMLEPWALEHHARKKRLAWHAYQRAALGQAQLLHATAPMEADHLRALGLTAPIAVVPNGVPLPDAPRPRTAPNGSPRQALFLSRIHPKKGLLNLMDAWAAVRPSGWRLVVAGPDEQGHRAEVEQRARARGIGADVTFTGPVDDDAKWDLYRASDLFVLPTFSENFGVVVAEALACGVPALTTTGAPWRVLEAERCGWWVPPEAEALAEALRDATARPDAERRAMGQRGRALVEARFSWTQVAADLHAAYRWLLGEGRLPACVRLD